MILSTPSRPRGRFNLDYAARFLHPGMIARAQIVGISRSADFAVMSWTALAKINFRACG
jgi:hypothetical protein